MSSPRFTNLAAGALIALCASGFSAPIVVEDFNGISSWQNVQAGWDWDGVQRDANIVEQGGYLEMWQASPNDWFYNSIMSTVNLPNEYTITMDFVYKDVTDDNNSFGITFHDRASYVGVTAPGVRLVKDTGSGNWQMILGGREGSWPAYQTVNFSTAPVVDDPMTLTVTRVGTTIMTTVTSTANGVLATTSHDYAATGLNLTGGFCIIYLVNFGNAPANVVWVDDISISDTVPAVIFSDDFADGVIDSAKWFTEDKGAGVNVGVWPENPGDPANPRLQGDALAMPRGGGYCRVTTRNDVALTDFDLVAHIKLTDLTQKLWLAAKIRQAGDETPAYTCAIDLANNNLELGPATNYDAYSEDVSVPMVTAPVQGDTITLLIQASGDWVRFGVSHDGGTTVNTQAGFSGISVTGPGWVNFANRGNTLIEIDGFEIYDVGTAPYAFFTAGVDEWNLLEPGFE